LIHEEGDYSSLEVVHFFFIKGELFEGLGWGLGEG